MNARKDIIYSLEGMDGIIGYDLDYKINMVKYKQ